MESIKRVKLSEISELITKGTTPTTLGYEFQNEEMLSANTNQALAIIRISRDDVFLPYIRFILVRSEQRNMI